MKSISLTNRLGNEAVITDKTRKVASVHLLFAGITNVITSVVIFYAILSGRLIPALIRESSLIFTEVELLQYGRLVDPIGTIVAPVGAVVLVIVGLVEINAARDTYRGRNWRRNIAASAVGAVNVLTVPMVFVSITLLYISKFQFDE